MLTPKQLYQQALNQGFVFDAAQEQAVEQLESCFHALNNNQPTLGVYLWGPVGRGKTWLMDSFFQCLAEQQISARRIHFHHFMRWLHQRLFQLTGTPNPLQHLAAELAQEIRVLCFDELFINDLGDATLLGSLLQALFKKGLVLLATSNQAPLELYANGFNRERILPALADLAANTQAIHLDGSQDHRSHGLADMQRFWLVPAGQPSNFAQLFQQLSQQKAQATQIEVHDRSLSVLGQHPQALWCSYAQLCEGHWAATDYITLAEQHRHILISQVPCLSAPQQEARIARGTEDSASRVLAGERQLAPLSAKDNGVRRFIALIDECYEQQVPVYLEAEVDLINLYTEGTLIFAFQRTLSRLQAMQRSNFGN